MSSDDGYSAGARAAGRDPAARGAVGSSDAGAIDAARLAHELRTPLGAITTLAEMIRDERLGPLGNPRYRDYAADIHDSAAHATMVLAALLDPAGTQRGASGPMVHAELDLALLVSGSVSALAPLAETAGVGLLVRLPDGLPHVIADRRSLRQMLNNLIANALKYTPPGGEVVVSLDYLTGGPVHIDVADTGDGMSPAELARVRDGGGAEALRRRSGGTGIGLPLVRALAAANGARLEIDSRLGQGTRARIVLPHDRVVPV